MLGVGEEALLLAFSVFFVLFGPSSFCLGFLLIALLVPLTSSRWCYRKVDFRHEASNLRRFAENFHHSAAQVPKVFAASEQVLIMELVEACL